MNRPTRLLALLGLLAATAAAGDAVLDLVTLRDKGRRECWITTETLDESKWKTAPEAAQESTTRRAQIAKVLYAFQRQTTGNYAQGLAARDRGSYAEAADLFSQLAQGERESEKVVGAFEEGVSWEMAGKYADAATAFQKVVDGFGKHPLSLDAQFRLGMVLAQSKDAKAEEVAKNLDALSKGMLGLSAGVRAWAIRAAVAMTAGDAKKFRETFMRATFNPELDRPAWLYFNLFVADGWRRLNQPKEAVPVYERMLKGLGDDAANAARVRLGVGLCKAETDPQGAIIDLLALDALPYGSAEEKCEARYTAGRLLLAIAQAGEKDAKGDANKQQFAQENLRSARLLLESAAGTSVDHPSKAKAAELLKTLPAEKKAEEPKPADKPADKPAGK